LSELRAINYNLNVLINIFRSFQSVTQPWAGTPFQQGFANASMVGFSSINTPTTLNSIQLSDPRLITLHSRLMSLPPDAGRSSYHSNFLKNYKKLLYFKQMHGHIKVNDKTDPVLCSWVRNQRTNVGNYSKGRGPLVGRTSHYELLRLIGVHPYGS
jgi:hypothetical protein